MLASPGATPAFATDGKAPVRIGLTAEYGLKHSFSAQAVELGIRVAIEEINGQGGVLGGRPLVLETRDDRSLPARAVENLRELAARPDLVAVFGARFSPVLLEMAPVAQELGMILLDPWASADAITRNAFSPSYIFRLSLQDHDGLAFLLDEAARRGRNRVGLLLPNTSWGRSSLRAAEDALRQRPGLVLSRVRWYNWGDRAFTDLYKDIKNSGADILVMVANDAEGTSIVNEIAALPEADRLPILAHWGITGGEFFAATRDSLPRLDLSVIQTFSFFRAAPDVRDRFLAVARTIAVVDNFESIQAPVGVGQAYDLTRLLALAIDQAGSTDRAAIRDALERLGPYHGLVADLARPFSPERHDALGPDALFLARYRDDGVLAPVDRPAGQP